MDAMKKFFITLYIGNILILTVFWFYSSFILSASAPLYSLGKLFGLIGMNGVLFQLILIGRSKWLEGRYGFDSMATIHQENGRVALGFLLMHPIFLLIGDFSSFSVLVGSPFVILAIAGLSILTFIVIFSNPLVMKKIKYEKWYYTHLIVYLAITLVLSHQFVIGSDFARVPAFRLYWIVFYVVVVSNFIFYRVLKPLIMYRRHRFVVDRIIKETADTASFYITGQDMDRFKFKGGQFILLRFLINKLKWQVHPFSISALPDGKFVRVTIKVLGDYTKELMTIQSGTHVMIDGPYGRFTVDSTKKEKVLLIAAGSGITAIRPVIEELIPYHKDMILLFSNKTKKDIIFQDELNSLVKKNGIQIYHFITREKNLEDGIISGRITLDKIQELVPDLLEREIFMCAPYSMMRMVQLELISIGFDTQFLRFEKFAWVK
jgi:predicted ferric reductase